LRNDFGGNLPLFMAGFNESLAIFGLFTTIAA
jgi:hypothetical protein